MWYEFLTGSVFMGYLVAGFFFIRFWRKSRDRLFLFFALAFLILAANRAALVVINEASEPGTFVFALRLIAYLLFLYAIVDKNYTKPRKPTHSE